MNLAPGWAEFDEVGSTQEEAATVLREGRSEIGIVFAEHQCRGRGRLGRVWESKRGESLTMSLIFWDYTGAEKPWLIGMSCAVAAAQALGCNVRWPNDLSFGALKTGGVLTEILATPDGRRVPVVGIGVNLAQKEFPQELAAATSVYRETGVLLTAREAATAVLARLARLPEPGAWSDLEGIWMGLDKTPGKRYRLPSGEEGVAIAVGEDGALRCMVRGEERLVFAADALVLASSKES